MRFQRYLAKARELSRGHRLTVITIASAVLVSVALQAITIARNNYSLWRISFMGIEIAVALASSYAANLISDAEDRGRSWAKSYVPEGSGWLYTLLAAVPPAGVRSAVMCTCLSVVNATIVPIFIYRETVANPVAAVIVRILADLPACFFVCLVVLLVVDWLRSLEFTAE